MDGATAQLTGHNLCLHSEMTTESETTHVCFGRSYRSGVWSKEEGNGPQAIRFWIQISRTRVSSKVRCL